MSLFADKRPLAFNAFGVDSFHNSSLGGFFWGGNSNFFEDRSKEETFPSKMRLGTGSTLTEKGFYEDFDSIFHDMSPSVSRRQKDDSNRRTPQTVNGKGKEYIIPIKIETCASTAPGKNMSYSSKSKEKDLSSQISSKSTSASQSLAKDSVSGSVIQIPIIRESSTQNFSREKSRSPVVSGKFVAPSNFALLTPATQENGQTAAQTRRRTATGSNSFSNDIVITKSDNRCAQKQNRSNDDSDFNIIEVEEEEEETTIRRLCRKPLRHWNETAASSGSITSHDAVHSDVSKYLVSPENDAEKTDAKREKNETLAEREEAKVERSQPLCSNTEQASATPAPSYPIYDHLRPRLANIGRQVDYIRGDGNCFFRALSKEMYGSEDYHAEWREAVCDVIACHPQVFAQYIDDTSVNKHVEQMRVLGTWATTCEIYASASLLQREIYVLAPSPAKETEEYHWLLFSPRSLDGPSSGSSVAKRSRDSSHTQAHPCYLTLCHTNGNHYDRIMPVFARCNCEIPPPSLNGVSLLLDLTASEEEELMQS